MALTKGSAFTARFQYLKTRHPRRWDAYVASLEPAARALAVGPCLKGSWYPFAAFIDVNLKADRMFGKGDLTLLREMGREAAKANMPVLYKLFFKVGSPGYVFEKVAGVFRQLHDSGNAHVTWNEKDEARFELRDFAAPHQVLCRALEGFLLGTLEVMGLADVTVTEIKCRTMGGPVCEYLGRWKSR